MRVLLLAGTNEARALAQRLDRDGRIELFTSLAGATSRPAEIAGNLRVGGFGGRDGNVKFIKDNKIDAVLDVTHPFAQRISRRMSDICGELGVPYLQVLRPAWVAQSGDDWRRVSQLEDVGGAIADAQRVFLGTGPGSVEEIGPLPVERVLCRRIDAPKRAYPHDNGDWIQGRPPFSVEDEIAFFKDHRIDLIVTKNAGGTGGWAKVEAARMLGLPVVMVDRPEPVGGDLVDSVEGALDWIEAL